MARRLSPETSLDRWLVREGWHWLRWSCTKDMVQLHDRIGLWLIGAAPVLAATLASLANDPSLAVTMLPVAILGGVHFGCSRFIRQRSDMWESDPPALTPRARELVKRLVLHSIGMPIWEPKYYGRSMIPKAKGLRAASAPALAGPVVESLEALCRAYNRVAASLHTEDNTRRPLTEAVKDAFAQGLDLAAHLEEYPEQGQILQPRLAKVSESLEALAVELESVCHQTEALSLENLSAWAEALSSTGEDAEQVRA